MYHIVISFASSPPYPHASHWSTHETSILEYIPTTTPFSHRLTEPPAPPGAFPRTAAFATACGRGRSDQPKKRQASSVPGWDPFSYLHLRFGILRTTRRDIGTVEDVSSVLTVT